MSDNMSVKTYSSATDYPIQTPSGRIVEPPASRCWAYSKERLQELILDNRIWFGAKGTGVPRIKRFLSEVQGGIVAKTIWLRTEVGDNQDAKREIKQFDLDAVFDTPKPEELLNRILFLATNPGDLVLDSFLGSGTTAAVAHKMGRRYIGIELGEHARTHCQPRLKKVVEGEQGGISKAVNWQGGGGFRFLRLGETVFDEYGSLNPAIRFAALAAHIWYLECRQPMAAAADSPLLGVHNDTAYYLLYNGILGDRRPDGGNVLTSKVLTDLPDTHAKRRVVYGESCRLGSSRLQQEGVVFKQIPYDVGMF